MGMYDEALDRERIRNGTNLITSGAFFSGRRWQAPPQATNGAASRVDRGSDAEYRLESDGRVLPVVCERMSSEMEAINISPGSAQHPALHRS
jgi:hypothetical protein